MINFKDNDELLKFSQLVVERDNLKRCIHGVENDGDAIQLMSRIIGFNTSKFDTSTDDSVKQEIKDFFLMLSNRMLEDIELKIKELMSESVKKINNVIQLKVVKNGE